MNEAEIRKRLIRPKAANPNDAALKANGEIGQLHAPPAKLLRWYYALTLWFQFVAFVNFIIIAARGGFTVLLITFVTVIIFSIFIVWKESDNDNKIIIRRALARTAGKWVKMDTTFDKLRPFLFANFVTMIYISTVVFQPWLFRQHHGLTFSRIGQVTEASAALWIRYPPVKQSKSFKTRLNNWLSPGISPFEGTRTVRAEYKLPGEELWHQSPEIVLTSQHDFTGSTIVKGLKPDTRYEYRWTENGQPLAFLPMIRKIGKGAPEPKSLFHFNSAPTAKSPRSYSFGFGSCIRPDWPFSISGITGFRKITQFLSSQTLDFFVFLGDWIYSDAPFVFGDKKHHFDFHYRRNLEGVESQFLSNLPSYFAIDDHDVRNNWNKQQEHPYLTAMSSYNDYCGCTNPPSKTPYYSFDYADSSFFVMDTRTWRDETTGTMLGKQQLSDLFSWMASTKNSQTTWRFIASSVPFTYNWKYGYGADDTWWGFQEERKLIFDEIHRLNLSNVVLLSGDRHLVCVNEFANVTQHGPPLIEFSASPINQFVLADVTQEKAPGEKLVYSYAKDWTQWGRILVERLNGKPRMTMQLYTGRSGVVPKWEKVIEGV